MERRGRSRAATHTEDNESKILILKSSRLPVNTKKLIDIIDISKITQSKIPKSENPINSSKINSCKQPLAYTPFHQTNYIPNPKNGNEL